MDPRRESGRAAGRGSGISEVAVRKIALLLLMSLALWPALDREVVRVAAQHPSAPDGFPSVNIEEIVLANGFRVLVVQDSRVARVASSLWYRIGSAAEAHGEHGSAHFLEHVVHQGTTTIGTTNFEAEQPILREIHDTEVQLVTEMYRQRKELREREVFYDELSFPSTPRIDELRKRLYALEDQDSRFREYWAEYNWYKRYGSITRHTDPVPATTSKEQIEIDIDLPVEHVELFFRMEADRMVNAVLRGWEAQRFTVFEQRLNRQGRPETRFDYEALEGLTAPFHPSYHPSGGHLRDFAYFNRQKMLEMYDRHFVPNNATLVLVGDIAPSTARTFAEKYFGAIPRGPEPPNSMDVEASPVPGGTVRLDWAEALSARVVIRYRIPAVGHPDRPAFDTIAQILTDELTARLDGRQGPQGSVDVSAGRRGAPSTLTIDVSARTDEDLPAIEAVVLDATGQLQRASLSDVALGRARKMLRFEWERTRSDRGGLAFALGHFEVMDSWRTLEAHMTAREQVAAADIQRLANRYLVPANLVVATSRRKPAGPSGGQTTVQPTTGALQ